jgi:hypothetical protein
MRAKRNRSAPQRKRNTQILLTIANFPLGKKYTIRFRRGKTKPNRVCPFRNAINAQLNGTTQRGKTTTAKVNQKVIRIEHIRNTRRDDFRYRINSEKEKEDTQDTALRYTLLNLKRAGKGATNPHTNGTTIKEIGEKERKGPTETQTMELE